MTSLKSQLFYFTLRNRHLLQLRLKPEVWNWNTSIPEFRQICEEANARLANKMPAGVEVSSFTLAGIPAEWLLPAGASKEKVILYCIGGGYVSGSCNDHRQIVAKVA